MSGQYTAGHSLTTRSLGKMLRDLRSEKRVPLWTAAAEACMDSTLLSKIERGHRLPTNDQAVALAVYYDVPSSQIEAALMAERFWKAAKKNPAAAVLAAARIAETAGEYLVKQGPTTGNNPEKVVNNSKKGK